MCQSMIFVLCVTYTVLHIRQIPFIVIFGPRVARRGKKNHWKWSNLSDLNVRKQLTVTYYIGNVKKGR